MQIHELYTIYLENPNVIIDSRKAAKGCLFFGLSGEHVNGGSFARQALDAGCTAAVVDQPEYAHHPGTILVEDALATLTALARFHRSQLNIPVIGITGSNGKTTTKELLAAVLQTEMKVVATQGNLNNHIGVPLTILSILPDTDIAVVEMGANHIGEIAALCEIAQPTHGLITMIGKAHLEGFGSIEGVITAKSELYRYLNQEGKTVFVNADDPLLLALLSNFKGSVISYGTSEKAYCQGKITGQGPALSFLLLDPRTVDFDGLRIDTQLIGGYNLPNLLGAACAGRLFGISIPLIAKALSSYAPGNNRSQLMNSGKNMLVLDYYNANPTSMEAALHNFSLLPREQGMLILGDMLELGDYSPAEHEKISQMAKESGAKTVFLVGPLFGETKHWNGRHNFESAAALASYLAEKTFTGYRVLIKGSRGIKLEQVLPWL